MKFRALHYHVQGVVEDMYVASASSRMSSVDQSALPQYDLPRS